MDILKKIEEAKTSYDEALKKIEEHSKVIQNAQKEIAAIDAEAKRIEGAFKTLVDIALDQGLIDGNGNVVPQDKKDDPADVVEKKDDSADVVEKKDDSAATDATK